ncbi:MAG: hypothetical protein H6581_27110 [Bacteroidia bacterium]|nr:hypothetical protein [Bacteroidia bacterium]
MNNSSSRKKISVAALICTIFFLLTSCQIQEGPGGMAAVTGKIYAKDYNASLTQLGSEYYAPKEDVFIVYGDNSVFDDKVETHFDGTFRFEFLRKGTYTIFVYSKDTTLTNPDILQPIIKTAQITSKGQEIDLGDLVIIK